MMNRIVCSALVLVSLSLAFGCGDGLKTVADINNTNIKRLHSAYMIYMNQHQMRGPKNADELKEFLTTNNTAKALLKRMEIMPEDVPGIFTSERDNEPFEVRWGLRGIADHAIVFEKTGVEGMRMVAFSRPRELDDDEYEGYMSGKIKPEAPFGAEIAPEAEGSTEEE